MKPWVGGRNFCVFVFIVYFLRSFTVFATEKIYSREYNQLFFLFKNIILPGCDVIQGIIIASRINILAIIIRARYNNTLSYFF
jgi:hypothetical protein